MVNAAKRMRALTAAIYHLRIGQGAITLPSGPQPQLKSIYMRLPTGMFPRIEYFMGGRRFWRTELQRLKYWNPALQCKVETVRGPKNEPIYLSVEYESEDKEALKQLEVSPLPKPLLKVERFRKKAVLPKIEKEQQKANSNANTNASGNANPDPQQPQLAGPILYQDATRPVKMTPEVVEHAPKDEIKVKAQPPADPSAPQSTSPPKTVYSRTVSLPIAGLRHTEIWNWIRQHTKLPDHRPIQKGEMIPYQQLIRHRERAVVDRERVKTGVEAMKREEAELKKAREAADRMAAENS